MPKINYGTTTIYYYHYKQARKDIKITVNLVNGVVVYTPEDIDHYKLHQFLKQEASWLLQKLHELNEINTTTLLKEFISGEKLPYFGRYYRLRVYKKPVPNASFQFKQGRFIAIVPREWTQEHIQQQLEQKLITWYREHGLKKSSNVLVIAKPC